MLAGARAGKDSRLAAPLALYEAILVEGRPLSAKRVKDFRWVASAEFDQYPFPDADQQTMDQLLGFSR